ncbi:MAG: transposase [Kiritimatiellia bacterium]
MTKGKKHMDGTKRCRIEFGLAAGESERQIARAIGVSLSTVSREIGKHACVSFKGCRGRANQCVHRADCRLTGVCGDCPAKGAPCVRCSYRNCNRFCGQVVYIDCPQRLRRTAGVCNGCPDEKSCHRRKRFYVASRAQEEYRRDLGEKRQGAALEPWEREYIDNLVSPKIRAGQSVHHICVTNAAKLTRNERTIQRYVNCGILSAKRGELKRACMMRPRKSLAREYQHKVETGCHVGRTFEDYQAFLAANPGIGPVFMDLVIGRPGGVCLLTLHWPDAAFMTGILIPNKCAANVVAVFDRLCDELGLELFGRLFQVILTDRGTEFSHPSRIEACEDGTKRTRVFFCDPMNSNQKSQIERNHEIVREILPKGVSLDGLSQDQAYLALSHVNAYVRLSQSDRTPYDVFEFLYGEGMAAKLHIMKIDPREVVLKPRLVGIEMK